MAALEKEGLLEKAHTSSGRKPSVAGFQYFVRHSLTFDQLAENELYEVVKAFDQEFFKLEDILQAILDDKDLADKAKAEEELKKRIEEMTAIAEDNDLAPQKYADMLKEGKSVLDVINILHADAAEMRQAQAEAERNTQNQSYTQNQPEFEPETSSEGNSAHEQGVGQKSQNMASDDVAKKYGYKFTVDLIFPAENAKEIKEQFKEWLNSHGVRFEPKSKSVKVEME